MTRPAYTPKVVAPAIDADTERVRSRAPVAAPGKRHRQPAPQEQVDERLGEAEGKQLGQKNMKTAWRGGRAH